MTADRKPRPAWAVRLQAERRKRLWSQKHVAARIRDAADPGLRATLPEIESLVRAIRRYEAGTHRPDDPYPALLSRVFGIDEVELFADAPQPATPVQPPPDLMEQVASVTGRRVGDGIVTDLSARVHGLRLADDVLAGGDLVEPAFRELATARRIYRGSVHTERVGRRILGIVGECAQIAGWIASDAGQPGRAEQTYRLGIEAAREAGDRVLEGNLLGSLAYQVSNLGDPRDGVRLARAALEATGPDAPPRARALSWDRVAWANARAGEAQATMRALGEASDALAGGARDDDPGYLYWVTAGELQVMEARAYTELRRPLRAIPILVDVLSRYEATHARELALYLSWLAVALIDANEPEEAAAVAARMLELSADVASDRTSRRASVVLGRLEPFRDVPQVRDVLASHA
ncbi:helix-turn-helix transcriptional regulator [Bailinhaonella thermotolerans]|uniref:XRE family transcriptional regulator n=1 Tax=Bailinhaonella thermotolerans TaxID=1070861 RepID=A0A3A4BKH5_9ACTN|nr:helix-turn-helix transcriptional regulator [Bailinhaonella thermotolerans]RJL35834.1 XRE family transcriptional regulator [Bailinhaonella thermotolerans]